MICPICGECTCGCTKREIAQAYVKRNIEVKTKKKHSPTKTRVIHQTIRKSFKNETCYSD